MEISTKKRENNLNEYERQRIVESYDKGTPINDIATVLDRKATTIRSFLSRYKQNINLPPKIKFSKSNITASVGIGIKNIIRENKFIGVRKIASKLKEDMPNEPWLPQKTAIADYLARNSIF